MLGRLIRECWREELGGGGLRVEMRVTQMEGGGKEKPLEHRRFGRDTNAVRE